MKARTIRIMTVIAIEEHFKTAMYRQHIGATEYRNFVISSRSAQVGYDIRALCVPKTSSGENFDFAG